MSTQAPSTAEQYNQELIRAHREALAALRELLAAETDPRERRRLAIAILKAKPVKQADPSPDTAAPAGAHSDDPPRGRTKTKRISSAERTQRELNGLIRLLELTAPVDAADPHPSTAPNGHAAASSLVTTPPTRNSHHPASSD